jgi:FAD:protein FMN transferase
MTATTVHLRRRCMATLFEAWLVGEDAEHLESVGHAALAEVARVESLLSRFDPAAEVARVNREAARTAVRVERELFEVLRHCESLWARTAGFFDVRVFRGGGERVSAGSFAASLELDELTRSVRFSVEGMSLDLGGYGKGYALDRAAHVLGEYGVGSAMMHGGTSSALAIGTRADGTPWRLRIRNPFAEDRSASLMELELRDSGYSHSAVFGERAGPSDVVDPHTGEPLGEQAACFVVMPSAAEAEAFSTGMLAMGRGRASELFRSEAAAMGGCRAAWIDAEAAANGRIHWLQPVTGVGE